MTTRKETEKFRTDRIQRILSRNLRIPSHVLCRIHHNHSHRIRCRIHHSREWVHSHGHRRHRERRTRTRSRNRGEVHIRRREGARRSQPRAGQVRASGGNRASPRNRDPPGSRHRKSAQSQRNHRP